MFEALDELPACRAVAGVELGGCPLASAVSLVSFQKDGLCPPSTYARNRRINGSKRLVEGTAPSCPACPSSSSKNVITTGGSTLKAVDRLVLAGVKVVGVWRWSIAWRGAPTPSRPPGFPSCRFRPAGTTSRIDRGSCSLDVRRGA